MGSADGTLTYEQNNMVESDAELLYGLIHVRYISTSKGMAAMVRQLTFRYLPTMHLNSLLFSIIKSNYLLHICMCIYTFQLEKYRNYDFGRCPRVHCNKQRCLPVGQSDIPKSSTVKIYCPKCEDVYAPQSRHQESIL